MSEHTLVCLECGTAYPDDGRRLDCDREHRPALLRAVYPDRQLRVDDMAPGIFQFGSWLPISTVLPLHGRPITYQSEGLAGVLGLSQLFVSFNGYWPERGADQRSCTFKQLEATTVLGRTPADVELVVASAGNTARAFAQACARVGRRVVLVVPDRHRDAVWDPRPCDPWVGLLTVSGDYVDAIRHARILSSAPKRMPEGGVKNVARRAGMGTTVLDAAVRIGRLPDRYFQAVGSGTGGIAAWEASELLLSDGRFGSKPMRLHLGQNRPFTPMVDAWRRGSPTLLPTNDATQSCQIAQLYARVLSNRRPAYGVRGGVYDALTRSGGELHAIDNTAAGRARELFEHHEGIDICPPAAVAVATLLQACESGAVRRNDVILLNVTGGGQRRLKSEIGTVALPPLRRFVDRAGGELPSESASEAAPQLSARESSRLW